MGGKLKDTSLQTTRQQTHISSTRGRALQNKSSVDIGEFRRLGANAPISYNALQNLQAAISYNALQNLQAAL